MSTRLRSLVQALVKQSGNMGLEDIAPDTTGARNRELEYTFYGQVKDLKQLEANSFKKEKQEQWLVPIETDKKGKMRIRRIDDKRCIATTKFKRSGMKGSEEVEQDIPNEMFEHLKEMGTGGYIKTRYFIKAEESNLIWEIDVFKNSLGQDHDWVKVDLEVPTEETPIPKQLPVEFLQFITHQPNEQTAEERAQIDTLWSKEWVSMDSAQKLN